MTAPTINAVDPSVVPTSGGELLALTGEGLTPEVAISFGDAPADRVRAYGGSNVYVASPPRHVGSVDVRVQNLDADGEPIPDEVFTLPGAVTFARRSLAEPSNLVRLTRAVIQRLKRDVLDNTVLTVSVDYRDDDGQVLRAVPLAELPSLVLTGPTLKPSPNYVDNGAVERRAVGPNGPELKRQRRRRTKDVEFALTGAAERTQELVNLMSLLESSLVNDPWITLARDPNNETLGAVRWPFDIADDVRTNSEDREGVRVFQATLTLRGFDVAVGAVTERAQPADSIEVAFEQSGTKGELCP